MPPRPTVKPHMWSASRDKVMPKWQWCWDGLVWGSAFWGGGKQSLFFKMRDLTGRAVPAAFTGASNQHQFRINKAGLGYEHLNNSGGGTLEIANHTRSQPFTKYLTMVWHGSFPSVIDDANVGLFAFAGAGEVCLFWWLTDALLRFRVLTAAGTSEFISSFVIQADTEPHTFVGTYDGLTTRLYIDGTEVGTDSTTSTITTGTNDLLINEYGNNAETAALNSLALLYNRTWTPKQIRQFQTDQFGMLRRAPPIVNVVAAAAARRRLILVN